VENTGHDFFRINHDPPLGSHKTHTTHIDVSVYVYILFFIDQPFFPEYLLCLENGCQRF
jgi:hypothetical protein